MKHNYLLILLFFLAFAYDAQAGGDDAKIKLNPTNWWIGMKYNKVQVLVRGNTTTYNNQEVSINYPGVKLTKIHRLENTRYYALDITIDASAKPGVVKIKIGSTLLDWPISKKNSSGNGSQYAMGATSKDLMYLIMPDRFSNGDPSNDRVPGMRDQSLNRDTVFNRHGGDLQGIIDHLSYFNDLGVTALWLNPVLENDMKNRTEHGYAFTDHYTIDPRLGGHDAYKKLVDAAHAKGIKIIQDAVYNHVGIEHWCVTDPPMKSWLHNWPSFTQTSYKDQVLMDPYASEIDKKIMSDGWFVTVMPDLDQTNPYVANFLIQHALWSVEEFGIDGWRIDTYAYNDLEFMNKCNAALMDEYPKISIFGETWVHGVPNQSYFAQNNYDIPYKSNMPGVTDFQLLWGINDVMSKPFGWTDGVNKLYSTIAQDFVYKNPYNNVIFLDNHDISRAYSVYNEDIKKYKVALSWLLTCRGIPQLYYGGEVLMTGVTNPSDGYVRKDFPGGWKDDKVNKFTATGRNERENVVWNLISNLANYRKTSKALTTGKMVQFAPQDGVYVYFRFEGDETVMCVMNTMDIEKEIRLDRFAERTKGYTRGSNLVDRSKVTIGETWKIPSWSMWVIKLEK